MNGFGMKSSAPAWMAFVFSWPMLDVTMITGSTAVVLIGAKPGADRVAVEARHHHVEQDQVGLVRFDDLECRNAVARGEHVVPTRREHRLEQADVLGDVVHHEDPSRALSHEGGALRSCGGGR